MPHLSGIIQYLSFCDWFVSLNIMSSGFIHIVICDGISFHFKATYYSVVCGYHILFVYSSVSGLLHYFHLLSVVNNAVMNINMQIALQDSVFHSFWCIPRSGITESDDGSVFEILRNRYTVCHAFCKPTSSMNVLTSPYPCEHLFCFNSSHSSGFAHCIFCLLISVY
jgi:hypothetical protein